jgi:hypothetical protein
LLGEDKKKFKARSGETVCLADLLDEGRSTVSKSVTPHFVDL